MWENGGDISSWSRQSTKPMWVDWERNQNDEKSIDCVLKQAYCYSGEGLLAQDKCGEAVRALQEANKGKEM